MNFAPSGRWTSLALGRLCERQRREESRKIAKVKKKLTAAQKRAKKKAKGERQKKYMLVFMNGKQVQVKRPVTIDGIDVEEFTIRNADPIWLHQNEMWEYIDQEQYNEELVENTDKQASNEDDEGIPF